MSTKAWSRKSKFTKEQRIAIAKESLKEPDSVVAARHGIAKMNVIQNWRKRYGLNKPLAARGSTVRKDREKTRGEVPGAKRRARANGGENGRTMVSAPSRPEVSVSTPAPATFDSVREQLQTALAQLDQMQANWLRVFGGE